MQPLLRLAPVPLWRDPTRAYFVGWF